MSEEILINVTPQETRIAMMENGVVQEIQIERSSSLGLVGNVYRGVVCRVLPGMQSAFIEMGLQRAAFCMQVIFLNVRRLKLSCRFRRCCMKGSR